MNPSRELAAGIQSMIDEYLPSLEEVQDGINTARSNRPSGKGWSQREELGHLLDSAINNHGRFVRAALQEAFEGPGYEQDGWVRIHGYRDTPFPVLVQEWAARNASLARLVAHIPEGKLDVPCRIAGDTAGPLRHIIADYVVHARHHLDQILRRKEVTKYPVE
jgi:hypothetical protein